MRILSRPTNRDLRQLVQAGHFREDLYFRLNAFPIQLPPLRQRQEDIPLLTTRFMEKMAAHLQKDVNHVAPEALARLQKYEWPGNVRELEHVIQRAVIVSRDQQIGLRDIALEGMPVRNESPSAIITLEEMERRYIYEVLEKTRWIVRGPKGAARLLGVPESTLRSRTKKLGVKRPSV
jgi:formate hydrogenlyase transcriptional activator